VTAAVEITAARRLASSLQCISSFPGCLLASCLPVISHASTMSFFAQVYAVVPCVVVGGVETILEKKFTP